MRAFFIFSCFVCAAQAQIKTAGIKTHYPSSASLVEGNSTDDRNGSAFFYHTNYHTYENFVPADTYQGEHVSHKPSPAPLHTPVFIDPIAEFINKTRSTMASGVCYKEVLTTSLLSSSGPAIVSNGTSPNMSKIQVCCEGYERNPHIYARCDPICADGCLNGICTAPNTCVCIPNHVRYIDNKCITTCPLGCGNGICDENGECRCRAGYVLEPIEKKFCIPHCENKCQFGKCVAPNKCECLDGYRLTASGACEPSCDNCENGKCSAPGVCVCNQGYEKIGDFCEPICSLGCEKGKCISPDTCACPAGLDLDRSGTKCIPHCDLPCLNGVCEGGNTCACNPGYILDENQRNICQPHCPEGCPNGFCSRPNFCICKPGFRKSGIKGRQTCMAI